MIKGGAGVESKCFRSLINGRIIETLLDEFFLPFELLDNYKFLVCLFIYILIESLDGGEKVSGTT